MQDWMVHESEGNIGYNLIDMGDHKGAINYYTDLIASDPDNDVFYFWRGRSYRESALVLRRQNNRENNEESISHFQKSNDDYRKALELHREKTP